MELMQRHSLHAELNQSLEIRSEKPPFTLFGKEVTRSSSPSCRC